MVSLTNLHKVNDHLTFQNELVFLGNCSVIIPLTPPPPTHTVESAQPYSVNQNSPFIKTSAAFNTVSAETWGVGWGALRVAQVHCNS